MLKCLEDDKSIEKNNILTSLRKATDKETGEKLSLGELIINANVILYISADGRRLTMQGCWGRYFGCVYDICFISHHLNSESVEQTFERDS